MRYFREGRNVKGLNDGGPVFPLIRDKTEDGKDIEFEGVTWWEWGLSKREFFAAMALAGGLEQGVEDDMNMNWWHSPKKIAKRAYAIADALIAEVDEFQ